MPLDFRPLGDSALRITAAPHPGPAALRTLRTWCHCLEESAVDGVVDWVPAYVALTVFYQPTRVHYKNLCIQLEHLFTAADDAPLPLGHRVTLPVCYGGAHGPDLAAVASHHGLTAAQVIELHAETDYLVAMIGFAPGFPYLWGLSPHLHTPRLPTPRLAVPAGSVGIGGEQTGVYPLSTPGGWRLIGHTPARLFDPAASPPALLAPGDAVRFQPVSVEEHGRIARAVAEGTYRIDRQPWEEP